MNPISSPLHFILKQTSLHLQVSPKMSSSSQQQQQTGPKLPSIAEHPTTKNTPTSATPVLPMAKYSNRVLLKTILENDGGRGFVGERVVVGGWVKASREIKKEPLPSPQNQQQKQQKVKEEQDGSKRREKDVSCVEILQQKIPFFRTIVRVLAGPGGGSHNPASIREKLESIIPKPPVISTLFLQINDGSSVQSLQVMVDSTIISSLINFHSTGTCLVLEGVLEIPSSEGKHVVQLKAEKILHIGKVDQDKYILSKKRLPLESLRDSAHFRPRTTTVASVMRIRSALMIATHRFFQENGFLYVQVPVITTTDFEDGGEKFHVTTLFRKSEKEEAKAAGGSIEGVSLDVMKSAAKEKSKLVEELKRSDSNKEALVAAAQDLRKTNELIQQLETREKSGHSFDVKVNEVDFSKDFFARQAYLTGSGRHHLESYACALGNVYSFGPRFHAERTNTAKSAAETWMVEVEMAFSQLEDAIDCANDYFKFLCKWILEKCLLDMEFIYKRIDKTCIDRLQSMLQSSSFEKLTYTEALKTLESVTAKKFQTKLEWGVALTAEHLSYLADEIYKGPVIVYNHPKATKPFYTRQNNDGITVATFDIVLPKVGVLISGSQNEERLSMLTTRMKELGLAREEYEWYMDLRRHGTVKHSGFSFGFDVMTLFTTGLSDVRDVIPFPVSFGKANN